eukprot:GFUD01131171.1.p1 GENE.GFUD01131171.1~~GFUD01131171.1.p1  ORF type:complete len:121 (+),score=32.77 GFUD01131171.1:77-439(+)
METLKKMSMMAVIKLGILRTELPKTVAKEVEMMEARIKSDPRNWTYDQVVGELCRMDRRLLYKDLGPLLDKKVAGDVLLRCSLDVLLTVLELDFNTAMRVTDQVAKLKMVVRGLDEIVIK